MSNRRNDTNLFLVGELRIGEMRVGEMRRSPQWISILIEDTSLLQCLVVTVTAVSSTPKASWVVMYTVNNHTTAMRESDNRLAKHCIKVV